MAAGLGFKDFSTGEVLTAADVDGYLMQGVLVFASAAARDAAITSPQEGQCCYLKDTDAVQTYSGSAWVGFDDSNAIQNSIVDAKGDIVAATANDTPARLAVGANDLILTAASGEATGLKYSGAWTSWTPTWTNLTVGNGTVVARYCQVGKIVQAFIGFNMGSTSSMGSGPFFTLPVTAVAPGSNTPLGIMYLEDSGVAGFIGNIAYRTTTTSQLYAISANGTFLGGNSFLTSSTPFTWGTGDFFNGYFSYEAA
jgi:hypothetical protein